MGSALFVGLAFVLAAGTPCRAEDANPQSDRGVTTPAVKFDPVTFADVPGWREDDHLAAWKAFLGSCGAVMKAKPRGTASEDTNASTLLKEACELAELTRQTGATQTREGARHYFETYFKPHTVSGGPSEGLLTGYYEPLLKGSRTPNSQFAVPVYRRPPDLVNVVPESERGAKSASFTHLRQTDEGLHPFPTRAAIEQGALTGQGLELLYLEDPVDVFFMQIQGSGRVELPTGEKVRITYDGKNGSPYTSIGRVLVEDGFFPAGSVTLPSLRKWLRADAKRAQAVMWRNESYIFFRELKGDQARGAMGVNGITLQAGRSLAVDTSYHTIGMPIFVSAPSLKHATKSAGFGQLMIAQDVGSAIKGPERGDIYFGSGDKAGRLAGQTKHAGKFYVLVPDESALRQQIAAGAP